MSHSLVLGMTESGKTTLAKQLVQTYKAGGIKTIVLDPLHDPKWYADYQTDDPENFLTTLWSSRSCAVFIDEAGDMVGRYDDVMIKTATRGRHWGHSLHYLSQRGTLLNRTVRDQCSHIFLFTSSFEDCKIHANEWNKPALKDGYLLPQGVCFHATRYGDLEKINIFSPVT